ncbi:MAG: peptide chain release factor 1 [Calditrichaeota bacterium]|nr:peptide chain release factor 1 [Calditrichota bacterium]
MIEKIKSIMDRFDEIGKELSEPDVVSDMKKYQALNKEYRNLQPIVEKYAAYKKIAEQIEDDQEILKNSNDEDLLEIARAEIDELEEQKAVLEEEIKRLLIPKDPMDEKNVIVEIRAGTGGEEAGLFAGDLFRMYSRYAERKGWKLEIMDSHPQEIGGFKEIIFSISGDDVYSRMKYEGGVHRVQRVPATEASGRVHTSAASVAVLPEAEDVDIAIDPREIRVDVFRSSGPGGQSVNTTDSAVRITHIPTGLVVSCQDEKSQHKNKAKALKILRSRLLAKKQEEETAKVTEQRRAMVSTGDRSAKIRTYNFPQNRLTDHRIGLTLYKLDQILDGNLDEVIEPLQIADQTEKLKKAG